MCELLSMTLHWRRTPESDSESRHSVHDKISLCPHNGRTIAWVNAMLVIRRGQDDGGGIEGMKERTSTSLASVPISYCNAYCTPCCHLVLRLQWQQSQSKGQRGVPGRVTLV